MVDESLLINGFTRFIKDSTKCVHTIIHGRYLIEYYDQKIQLHWVYLFLQTNDTFQKVYC